MRNAIFDPVKRQTRLLIKIMQILVAKKIGVLRMQGPDFSSISGTARRPTKIRLAYCKGQWPERWWLLLADLFLILALRLRLPCMAD
jgi:hypothetical protein